LNCHSQKSPRYAIRKKIELTFENFCHIHAVRFKLRIEKQTVTMAECNMPKALRALEHQVLQCVAVGVAVCVAV